MATRDRADQHFSVIPARTRLRDEAIAGTNSVSGEHAKQNRLLCAPVIFTTALIVLFVPPVHYLLLRWSLYALMFIPIAILFLHVISLLRRPPIPPPLGIVEAADV